MTGRGELVLLPNARAELVPGRELAKRRGELSATEIPDAFGSDVDWPAVAKACRALWPELRWTSTDGSNYQPVVLATLRKAEVFEIRLTDARRKGDNPIPIMESDRVWLSLILTLPTPAVLRGWSLEARLATIRIREAAAVLPDHLRNARRVWLDRKLA